MYRHLPLQPKLAYVDESGKLIMCHDSGFFSCSTIRLRKIINYINEYHKLPIVDSSRQWSMYKESVVDVPIELSDISTKFYKVPPPDDTAHLKELQFSTDTVEDQFSNYFKIVMDDVQPIINRYFKVSDIVLQLEDYLLQSYDIDVTKTIAVCYRGTDKRLETNIPSYEDMKNRIQLLQTQYPDYKILIQSDEVEFYEYISEFFPDLICINQVAKVTKNMRAVQFYIRPGQKILHAQYFLAIMQILSKCSNVILNSGNVGLWICLFRGNMNNVTQYLSPLNTNTENPWLTN